MNSPHVDHHFLLLQNNQFGLNETDEKRVSLKSSPPVDHLLLLTSKSPFSILAHLDNRLLIAMMLMTLMMMTMVMVMVLVLVMVIVRVMVAQKKKMTAPNKICKCWIR